MTGSGPPGSRPAAGASHEALVGLAGYEAQASVQVATTEVPEVVVDLCEARAWLLLAEQAAADGDHAVAAAAARRGLDVLGDSYRDPARPVEDDTELKVLAAGTVEVPAQRATLLARALGARLELTCQRFAALAPVLRPDLRSSLP
jgi:hypothetical protein